MQDETVGGMMTTVFGVLLLPSERVVPLMETMTGNHLGTLVVIMRSLSAIFKPYLVSLGSVQSVDH